MGAQVDLFRKFTRKTEFTFFSDKKRTRTTEPTTFRRRYFEG
jgi:hypothetical protein